MSTEGRYSAIISLTGTIEYQHILQNEVLLQHTRILPTLQREVKMAVHVVIKRKLIINDPEKLTPLMKELSERAKLQEGYISTDTLQSIDNPGEYLVISRWETEENWMSWFQSKERRDIQGKVDSLIGERTFYELFKPAG